MKTKLKWGDINALSAKIDEYFEENDIPTIAGLCLHLGVSNEFWKFYTSDRWQYKRKSDEEIERIKEANETIIANEGFLKITVLNHDVSIIDSPNKIVESETDSLKRQISELLKRTAQRIEDFTMKQVFSAKNPAGAIFYAKSALGYRETPSEQANSNVLPSKITIQIMPAASPELSQPGKVSFKNQDE